MSSYTLHRLYGFSHPSPFHQSVVQWSLQKKELFYGLFLLSIIGCLGFFFFLSTAVQWFLVWFGFLTLFYSVPLYFGSKSKRLKEFPGLKIFLIAYVWAGVGVLLPIVAHNIPVFSWSSQSILLERALFVLVITLPFDIRDIKLDQEEGIATIPSKIGIIKTKILGLGLLVIALLLNYYNLQNTTLSLSAWWFFFGFYGITAIGLLNASPTRSDLYCLFWMDGLFILFYFIVKFGVEV